MGKGSTRRVGARRLGEGNTEYVILLTFVLVCAVVGLFTSYSSTIKKMQLEKGLCLDCSQKDKLTANTGASASTTPNNNGSNNTNNNSNSQPDLSKGTSSSSSSSASSSSSISSWWDSFKDFLSWW